MMLKAYEVEKGTKLSLILGEKRIRHCANMTSG